jgi:hypothetical protein
MLAAVRKIRKNIANAILLSAAATFVSCASEKHLVVDDPDNQHESQMPWNKQEKWETGGQFAGMSDRR